MFAFLLSTISLIASPGLEAPARSLAFHHTHTGEEVAVAFKVGDEYVLEALAELNRFLRDHRTGDVIEMDPALFDMLWEIQQRAAVDGPYHLISAYRSPKTNEMLRSQGRGVARKSQHLLGKAIDVRLPGADTARLREIARDLEVGGVGYYRGSDFIHVDTGRVRYW